MLHMSNIMHDASTSENRLMPIGGYHLNLYRAEGDAGRPASFIIGDRECLLYTMTLGDRSRLKEYIP